MGIWRGVRIGLTAVWLMLMKFIAPAQDVSTWHNDMARTGVQPSETILNAGNVNSQQFGKVFSFAVTGDVYAQPLYLSQYMMGDGVAHNVLIVATAQDYIYAFDADGNNPGQGYLWSKSLVGSGETWVSGSDVGTVDINPNIGIIGTPVIDRSSGTIFVVAKSKDTSGTVPVFYDRLHALNIADGSEKLNGPTIISASVPGTADNSSSVTFNPAVENQRAALLLAPTPGVGSGSSVLIAFGSHGDKGSYHGWLISYDAADISNQNGAWTTTPNGIGGGVWMSGGGVSSDGEGNLFAASGNGLFDANVNGPDYGDSAVRLSLSSAGLQAVDSFTPADQLSLDTGDHDMGMSAMLLIPTQPGPLPHLAVTSDKTGTVYLINRDQMGGFNTPDNSAVQSLVTGYHIHSSTAFFNNKLYLGLDNGPLQAWTLNAATDQLVAQSATSTVFTTPAYSGGGGTPSISANGTNNGIAWIIQDTQYNSGPAVLHAYNAADLSQELYNSQQAANGRDTAAVAVKFTTPTIAGGRVYIGGRNAVTVYGVLSIHSPLTATPLITPGSGTYSSAQTVSITDTTPNASIYYTTDGTAPAMSSTLYTSPIQVSRSETIEAIAIAPGLAQSDKAIATYIIKLPTQVQVPLPGANIVGSFPDGVVVKSGGLDRAGLAYSGNQMGSSITLSGIKFMLGSAGRLNTISTSHATVIPLPVGHFSKVQLLATAVHKDLSGIAFTVTYTDGTASRFTQNMSPWTVSKRHSGELVAYTGSYCDTSTGGRVNQNVYLYRYSFALNSAKTVQSITLPANSEVAIAAITMVN
jgi:chitobiase/beta-hexosaminidase-like protein